MGNKLQKEKMEREATAKQGAGSTGIPSTAAAAPAHGSRATPVIPDDDYSNYNNKLTINDFALLKVKLHFSI
jgi:hypothetical protein